MRFRCFLIIFFLALPAMTFAQSGIDPEIELILESIAENIPDDFDFTELADRLNAYKKRPLDLNKASASDLKQLFFLTPIQIENLLSYTKTNGRLMEIYELQAIDGFDLSTINKLKPFISINRQFFAQDDGIQDLVKKGDHDLLFRFGELIEQQAGYRVINNKRAYTGSKPRILGRYRYHYLDKIVLGLNIEKDAGESFWQPKSGPDYVSGNLTVNKLSVFNKIVIGDYALQFGQGLGLWSGLSFGKGADITAIPKRDLGLQNYTSFNESSFFRGAASQINLKNISITPFISYQKIDGSSGTNTTLDQEEINSINITGLHRTATEIANKNNIAQFVFGSNINYKINSLSVGITAYHTGFDKSFAREETLYKRQEFAGKNLDNYSLNYSYAFKNNYFFGEFAKSNPGGTAYVNGLISSLSNKLSLVLLHRNYQRSYYSFFNQALAENSTAVNEKGFYSGLQLKFNKRFEVLAYTDVFTFPFLKYRVNAPSQGHEFLSQAIYSPNRKTKYLIRYKLEQKAENSDFENFIDFTDLIKRQNLRLEYQFPINKNFSGKSRVEGIQFDKENTKAQYGLLAFQDLVYNPLQSHFTGNLRLAYFNTSGFDTRIYAYENDVLYSFSIPALQDKGFRFYANGRYSITRGLDFWLRFAVSAYTNKNRIGSGNDEIIGNHRSEIKAQLRYIF